MCPTLFQRRRGHVLLALQPLDLNDENLSVAPLLLAEFKPMSMAPNPLQQSYKS